MLYTSFFNIDKFLYDVINLFTVADAQKCKLNSDMNKNNMYDDFYIKYTKFYTTENHLIKC